MCMELGGLGVSPAPLQTFLVFYLGLDMLGCVYDIGNVRS
jgi:hypothetical protein